MARIGGVVLCRWWWSRSQWTSMVSRFFSLRAHSWELFGDTEFLCGCCAWWYVGAFLNCQSSHIDVPYPLKLIPLQHPPKSDELVFVTFKVSFWFYRQTWFQKYTESASFHANKLRSDALLFHFALAQWWSRLDDLGLIGSRSKYVLIMFPANDEMNRNNEVIYEVIIVS